MAQEVFYLESVEDDRVFLENAICGGVGCVSKAPSLSYWEVVRALQRAGWVVVRQRGSHIRVQKKWFL